MAEEEGGLSGLHFKTVDATKMRAGEEEKALRWVILDSGEGGGGASGLSKGVLSCIAGHKPNQQANTPKRAKEGHG